MDRVLLTTTSFQDTPGEHHRRLDEAEIELVRARGPLSEAEMLARVGDVDAFLCGDDAITARVIDAALPRLRVISKYGIGLDKIDVAHATRRRIPVLFTPGVNHTTVAEHAFGLLIAVEKHIADTAAAARRGEWQRVTGHELLGKTIGIVGLGRIGKEVTRRARAFGMDVIAFDVAWDEVFAAEFGIQRVSTVAELLPLADIVSLHCNLCDDTRHLIDAVAIERMRDGAVVINCARGEVVDSQALAAALESGKLGGYGADVLEQEPPPADHPLLKAPNCVITPHIGSRTHESVGRQAGMAVDNLLRFLSGEPPLAQANSFDA